MRCSAQGLPAAVLDVRTPERRAQTGWIPGSIPLYDAAELTVNRDDEIVVYCDCPNDASAAVMARKLKEQGYRRVRPLAGGVEAWRNEGLPIDRSRLDTVIARPPLRQRARVPCGTLRSITSRVEVAVAYSRAVHVGETRLRERDAPADRHDLAFGAH